MDNRNMLNNNAKNRLFVSNVVENKDDFEEKCERSYNYLRNLIKGLSEKETHDVLHKDKCHEEISLGLLFQILTEPSSAPKSYRDLTLITRDGLNSIIITLSQLISERYLRLQEGPRLQLIWLVREMIRNGVTNVDSVCWNLMRQASGGDLSPKNLHLVEALLDTFQECRNWLEKFPVLLASVVYTFLRLLEDHHGYHFQSGVTSAAGATALATLRQKEINFLISVIRDRFADCLVIGRDFVRLLQNVARIPEFDQLWRDILLNPRSLAPNFTGLLQLMQTRTSRRFLHSRITPDVEAKLAFLTSYVRFGNHKRYQDWFQKQYLSTPESQTLRCDIIRYIVGVIHPTNEVLCSDIMPRWAIIGWLLTTCTSTIASSNAKLALFYDWLFFDPEKDNIMNIEPAILVMHNSMRSHPAVTATLIDFLCRIMTNFCPSLNDRVRAGIIASLRQIVDKRVLQYLYPLFDNPKLDRDLRLMARETFKEFCSVNNSHYNDNSANSANFSKDEQQGKVAHEMMEIDAEVKTIIGRVTNNHMVDDAAFSDDEIEVVSFNNNNVPITVNGKKENFVNDHQNYQKQQHDVDNAETNRRGKRPRASKARGTSREVTEINDGIDDDDDEDYEENDSADDEDDDADADDGDEDDEEEDSDEEDDNSDENEEGDDDDCDDLLTDSRRRGRRHASSASNASGGNDQSTGKGRRLQITALTKTISKRTVDGSSQMGDSSTLKMDEDDDDLPLSKMKTKQGGISAKKRLTTIDSCYSAEAISLALKDVTLSKNDGGVLKTNATAASAASAAPAPAPAIKNYEEHFDAELKLLLNQLKKEKSNQNMRSILSYLLKSLDDEHMNNKENEDDNDDDDLVAGSASGASANNDDDDDEVSDEDYELITKLASTLLIVFESFFVSDIFPKNEKADLLFQSVQDNCFFVIFRHFYKLFKKGDKRRIKIIALLSEMYSLQKKIGYFLLYFLKIMVMEEKHKNPSTDPKSHPYRASVYKEFCQSVEKRIDICLLDDMDECRRHEPSLLAWLVPEIFKEFRVQVVNNSGILHTVLQVVDAVQLQRFMCLVIQGQITFMKSDGIANLVRKSLEWETFEQIGFWQLLHVHRLSVDSLVTALPQLNCERHAEALTGYLVLLKNHEPSADCVKYLLAREPVLNDLFVTSVLKNWCNDHSEKLADLLSHLMNSRCGPVTPNKRKRNNSKPSNPVPNKHQILSHLNQFRIISTAKSSNSYNLYTMDVMKKALKEAYQNSNETQRKSYINLFAAFQNAAKSTTSGASSNSSSSSSNSNATTSNSNVYTIADAVDDDAPLVSNKKNLSSTSSTTSSSSSVSSRSRKIADSKSTSSSSGSSSLKHSANSSNATTLTSSHHTSFSGSSASSAHATPVSTATSNTRKNEKSFYDIIISSDEEDEEVKPRQTKKRKKNRLSDSD